QDWGNHLYYPHNNTHNAPTAVARWYNYTRDNFTAGNWEEGFFSLGVMSHYFQDSHIPVHTDTYWSGHSAYESDINYNLGILSYNAPTEYLVTNVSQLVVDGATFAHQFYDEIYDAYPDGSATALQTNTTIKTITEDCLSLAINGSLALYYTLTQFADAPDVSFLYQYVALIDYAHSNDYIWYQSADRLTDLNNTLGKNGFELRKQTTPFTFSDLVGVDLLILTCADDAYSTAELDAIAIWSGLGNKSILVTGRGDYSVYTDRAQPNRVLEAIGSNIRMNDDNVYMEGTSQLWYNDIYDIPAPADTLNLTYGVSAITFFSPNSLYFLDDGPVLPALYADASGFQTNENPPPITDIYDNTQDGANGEQIPLAALEEVGSLRILATGTTFFSNYDHGKTAQFDNILFLENFLNWSVANRTEFNVADIDEVGPRINDVTWTPAPPDVGELVNVTATVVDSGTIANVDLMYTSGGTIRLDMELVGVNTYRVQIPGITSGSLTFWIEAGDDSGNNATRASFTITWTATTTTTTTDTTTTTTTADTTTATTTTGTDTSTGLPEQGVPLEMVIAITGVLGGVVIVLVVIVLRRR
ncbi:MAG: hypothetical protein ACFFD9_03765, partial [Candidatus Thorarchaeota archaeon]